MTKKILVGLLITAALPAYAQNASSGSPRVQGTPAGYGDPVQVTIRNTDGSAPAATAVTQSGTWNLNNISGTVSLPTGAATAANQTTANTSLSTIATNTGAATPAGTNIIGKVGIDQTTPGTTNVVSIGQLGTTTVATGNGVVGTGTLRVSVASDSTGQVAISQASSGTSNAVTVRAAYTGGSSMTPFHIVSAANTNGQNLQNSAHMLYTVICSNTHATNWAFVKFYNKATSPTVGTDTPTVVIPCTPGQTVVWGGNNIGVAFSTGISIGISGGMADNDTTATAAGQVLVTLLTSF